MDLEFFVSRVAFAYYKKYRPGYIFRQENRKHNGLVFVLTGELTMTLEKEVVCAKAGSILLLRQGDSYKLETTASTDTEQLIGDRTGCTMATANICCAST